MERKEDLLEQIEKIKKELKEKEIQNIYLKWLV